MKPSTSLRCKRIFIASASLALAFAVLACVIPGLQAEPSADSGSLLPDPSAGLGNLKSYQAVYDLTLQGAVDGKPFDRQTHIEYTYVTQSQDRDVLWQERQAGGQVVFHHSLKLGEATYTRSQDGQECWGEVEDQPVEFVPSPASLLPRLTRASRVGAETVNGMAAIHYRFSQDGLPLEKPGASGEVWIVEQGGYVVKYTLSLPGPAAPTGKGNEIAETLNYELKQVDAFERITLPADCIPVLADIPAMADSQDVFRSSGYLNYTSPSAAAQPADFYGRALPPLGWTQAGSAPAPDRSDPRSLEYTQSGQVLTIFLDPAGGDLQVTILLYDPAWAFEAPAIPDPSPTSGPAPTADAAQSGLPADVPLYPGATDLKVIPNMGVNFTAGDAPDVVAKFYRDRLKSLQWSLQSETSPSANQVIQSWNMSKRMLVVTVTLKDGSTNVMLMLANQP